MAFTDSMYSILLYVEKNRLLEHLLLQTFNTTQKRQFVFKIYDDLWVLSRIIKLLVLSRFM